MKTNKSTYIRASLKKMKMGKLFTVIGVMLIISNNSFGQAKDSAFAFSVQQCIEYAYKNQANVANASADLEIARLKVKEITGMGLPQIGSSLDAKKFLEVPTSAIDANANLFGMPNPVKYPVGTLNAFQMAVPYNTTASIDASQLIFSSAYIVGLQATKAYLELSKRNLDRNKIETVVTVSKAYYAVLVNEERFKLLNANVTRLKKLADDTKVMNENGLVEKIDYSRIVVSYNNLLVEKEKVERFLAIGYLLLKFQMGMPMETKLTLSDKLEAVKNQMKMPALDGKVDYSQRVEYSLLQSQKRLNELDLRRNRLSCLPTIVAYGNYSSMGFGVNTDIFSSSRYWFPMSLIGAKISLPLFDGLQTHYKIRQAKLSILKNINDTKMLEQGIDMEVSSTRAVYQNQLASIEIHKKNIELAEEVFSVSKIKYDQGIGSNLELVNAEASLKEAQTNYYTALYDLLVAKIDLDKATGAIK